MGSGGREISILSNSLTAKLSTPPLSMVQKEKQQTLCVCVCVCIYRYIDILCNIMFFFNCITTQVLVYINFFILIVVFNQLMFTKNNYSKKK